MSSSPATRRNKVDLPQPEGPTKTTNSLFWMSRVTPLMTCAAPKDLRTSRMVISAMVALPAAARRPVPSSRPSAAIVHPSRAEVKPSPAIASTAAGGRDAARVDPRQASRGSGHAFSVGRPPPAARPLSDALESSTHWVRKLFVSDQRTHARPPNRPRRDVGLRHTAAAAPDRGHAAAPCRLTDLALRLRAAERGATKSNAGGWHSAATSSSTRSR